MVRIRRWVTMTTLTLSKALARRLERLAREAKVDPERFARRELADRLAYLEWERKAIAEGDADIAAGRVLSHGEVRKAIEHAKTQQLAVDRKTR
jgi:predicted transcriptional regulator